MQRFCLATFRGPDGRSLAYALACLLVLSGWLGALHNGSMTVAATAGATICSADGGLLADGRDPANPASKDHCVCCLLGCTTPVAGVAATAVAQLEFDAPAESAAKAGSDIAAVPVVRQTIAGPRGPPFLA